MADLIVIMFDNQHEAVKVREALTKAQREDFSQLDDAAVVQKDEEGSINIMHETDTSVKASAGVGGLLGLLIAFLFAGRLASIIIGAVGGVAIGSLTELGIEKKFVADVVKSLQPGSSALFIVVRDADPAALLAALRPYKGELFQTSLPAEAEEKLRSVLSSRS